MAPMEIESPANPRIRAALALRERRERDRTGLTLVDGAREARRAIEAGVEVETAFVCRELLASDDALAAVARLGGGGSAGGGGAGGTGGGAAELIDVSRRAFDRLAYGDRGDGIVLVVRAPATALPVKPLGPDPVVIITEDVEKPGNLGAILRSADATGATMVVAAGGTDLFNPNVIRASVGTVFSVPVAAAPAGEVRAWLAGHGLRIVAARVDAEALHVDIDLRPPVAIVLGSEADGLSATWNGDDVTPVRLPMLGVADSLNVAAAAAVLLYESWRQRRGDA